MIDKFDFDRTVLVNCISLAIFIHYKFRRNEKTIINLFTFDIFHQ